MVFYILIKNITANINFMIWNLMHLNKFWDVTNFKFLLNSVYCYNQIWTCLVASVAKFKYFVAATLPSFYQLRRLLSTELVCYHFVVSWNMSAYKLLAVFVSYRNIRWQYCCSYSNLTKINVLSTTALFHRWNCIFETAFHLPNPISNRKCRRTETN